MSKTKVERGGYANVITLQALETQALPLGSPVKINDDFEVALAEATEQHIGVTNKIHASGVYESIPVIVRGPVVRIVLGETVTAGQSLSGNVTTADGLWYAEEASAKYCALALEGGDAADEIDAVLI